MASSKLMSTTSTSNQDSPRHQSIYPSSSLSPLLDDPSPPHINMDTDDFFKNIYSSPPPPSSSGEAIWKEIVDSGVHRRMTLEDFLNKAVTAGSVRGEAVDVDPGINGNNGHAHVVVVAGNGNNGQAVAADGGRVGGRGRGKRRVVVAEEVPLDKASQQKQRRMIKNRESAARSRERKQAYTVELESLVTQLEEENASLQRDEAEQNKRRFKQLMKDLIPVTEKQRPALPRPGVLRRVHSSQW